MAPQAAGRGCPSPHAFRPAAPPLVEPGQSYRLVYEVPARRFVVKGRVLRAGQKFVEVLDDGGRHHFLYPHLIQKATELTDRRNP